MLTCKVLNDSDALNNASLSIKLLVLLVLSNEYQMLPAQAMSAPLNKGEQPQMNQNPGAFFWWVIGSFQHISAGCKPSTRFPHH